jgi:hypothetical protein
MLRGHVDLVTHNQIAGWAVDTERPNEPVDVCVYVDGRKRTQLTCGLRRSDLGGKEGLGDGWHGFRLSLSPPLSQSISTRVTVRHAADGSVLGKGDVILNAGTNPEPLDLGCNPPTEFQRLPAPWRPRQMLELLSLYDRCQGLFNLLCQIDLTGCALRQLTFAVRGTLALDEDEVAPIRQAGSPRDMLNELLLSVEFQQNILRLVLVAFPEKRRLLFVHIPKSAGSDLSHHLIGRYPSIAEQLRALNWTDKPALFETLGATLRRLQFSDSIFVRGHVNLAYYLEQGLARPCDRLFTILRDPVETAISQVNYILTRLKRDALTGAYEPDTQRWLALLGLEGPPAQLSSETFLVQLGRQALRAQEIVIANPMCHWLGGGNASAVLKRLAEHGVETTNTRCYPEWRRQRWGIEADTRMNESIKYLRRDTLTPDDLAYLESISVEDHKLYQAVDQHMLDSGACAVTDWPAAPAETVATAA